jgi:hypothetical protein
MSRSCAYLLYYACAKFHHYILSSACTVICHHDVIKYMLHRPILGGRVGKWAYSLVEYNLTHEPLRAMKGQIVADFIVDHMGADGVGVNLIEVQPWSLSLMGRFVVRGKGSVVF